MAIDLHNDVATRFSDAQVHADRGVMKRVSHQADTVPGVRVPPHNILRSIRALSIDNYNFHEIGGIVVLGD